MKGVSAPIVNGVDEVIVNSMIEPFNGEQTPYSDDCFDPRLKRCLEATYLGNNSMTPLKVLKFVLVGDLAVGKTSLIQRFCHKTFNNDYKPTIGCDFEIEKFTILNQPVTVQFWDTAGQERFRCIAAAYYRNAQCIILSFDLTKMETLLNCASWLNDALKVNTTHRPLVFLVGNKKDCLNGYEYAKVEELAVNMANQLDAEYWPTSSKSGENVRRIFSRAAALAFQRVILADIPSSVSNSPAAGSQTPGSKQFGNGISGAISLPSATPKRNPSDASSTIKVVEGPAKRNCCSVV